MRDDIAGSIALIPSGEANGLDINGKVHAVGQPRNLPEMT
jgi:hypothetical protein